MKIKSIILALVAMLTFASCGVLGSSVAGNSDASKSGHSSGVALRNLYSSYKESGKLDMTNISTMLQMASLVNGVQELKSTSDKSSFYADFASGLILGSNNLVNKSNSDNVMSTLTTLSNLDLSAITNAASNNTTVATATGALGTAANIAAASESVSTAVSSLGTIFSLFGN
ncbi:MAG: hypothetical protein J6U97_06935 [Bacteroidaceae bacterium]|nr:hypothetical protein [Bacteroidaceae bacterium]